MLKVVEYEVVLKSVIFLASLIGATMQDGGKRERRSCAFVCNCVSKKNYEIVRE